MVLSNRYSDYDSFAWVYNKHWGNQFTPIALSVLEKFALPFIQPNANILDLCCGTGQLAQILTERCYRVTGLDGSKEMLRFAHKNAPDTKFIMDDARTFKLPAIYNLVISMFDSLNHIMTYEELTAVFLNAHVALQEGGLFLFDLNLEHGYKVNWDGSHGIAEDDYVCVFQTNYSPEEHTARLDVTIFRLEDNWRRSDFTLIQRCYSKSEVQSALETAGFVDISAYVYDRQLGWIDLTKESDRAFFLCRK